MLDEKRLALMRHWAESDAFREHPWVRELLDAYDGATLADRTDRAALEAALALLENLEWRPEKNMRGTMTNFCPVCSGTPSVYAMNPQTARPDGHWLIGVRLPEGGCPLAQVLDILRAALASVEQGDSRE